MNIDRCHCEDELLDGLGRGYVGAELTAHIADCPSCSELHLVAGALLDERIQAIMKRGSELGTMLWRMQMRERQDAQATARRSLLVGQAMTLAVAIALMVSLLGADVAVGVHEAITSIDPGSRMLLVVAAFLVFFPIAGYVAIKQK